SGAAPVVWLTRGPAGAGAPISRPRDGGDGRADVLPMFDRTTKNGTELGNGTECYRGGIGQHLVQARLSL
ncbi:hypothetical protein, partial [Candidatus Methylomirabilis sp.]|uniref:hypothetical protein n=1 Tax=Candidatus Methylomirabilis sp. TaxID=2032687 RepID=UPI002A5E7573|nr:hypothetical protein [Candidatus Methylomirabilis sp.]